MIWNVNHVLRPTWILKHTIKIEIRMSSRAKNQESRKRLGDKYTTYISDTPDKSARGLYTEKKK